jgi:hypothetical protein
VPRIAAQTVRRRLRENGLRARHTFKYPILTQRHRRQRLEWAREHLPWISCMQQVAYRSPVRLHTCIRPSARDKFKRDSSENNFLPSLTSPRQMLSCPFQSLTSMTLGKYWIFECMTSSVANNFNCNHSTIVRLRQRFLATNTVADRSRPGAPRVTTQAQDQMIRLQHLRERFRTATVTARETVWTL